MPTIKNDNLDSVSVNRGGFGGDNAFGTVKSGTTGKPVQGATVTVKNMSKDEDETATTNTSGRYDVDIDLASGELVQIEVTFVDSDGAKRTISGSAILVN